MEADAPPFEKSTADQLPPSYYPPQQPSEQMAPPPSYSQIQPPPPPGYPNMHQPQPMMYPNMQQPQVMVASQVVAVQPVKDYMNLSLVTLLCCCWPIGICALLSSLKVRDSLRVGDHVGAMNASRSARSLNIAGIVVGCLIFVAVIVGVVVMIVVRVNACTSRRRFRGEC